MKIFFYSGYLLLLMMLTSSCKKIYMPDVAVAYKGILVVEGMINLSDSTLVKLSRTVSVDQVGTVDPELGASVFIESNKGLSYKLTEKAKGTYAAPSLALSPADEYRLRVITIAGSEYRSAFVQAKVSPPIDDLITDIKPDGVRILLNTHDPANNTRYYRWEYAETWEFNTYLRSDYYYNGTNVVRRTTFVDHCWGNRTSSNIFLASTINLDKDVINNRQMLFIEASSEKLTMRYSVLIRQFPLTKEAYAYYEHLRNNNEQLGTIFDPMPSSPIGNIRNKDDDKEPVIGFVTAGTMVQKRIFIEQAALPFSYREAYFANTPFNEFSCLAKKDVTSLDFEVLFGGPKPQYVPIIPSTAVPTPCADCTVRGTVTRPSFW